MSASTACTDVLDTIHTKPVHYSDERTLMLSTLQVADRIGTTERFLEARRLKGDGPKYISVSSRCVRYRWGDVLDWIESRARTSTSDQGQARGAK